MWKMGPVIIGMLVAAMLFVALIVLGRIFGGMEWQDRERRECIRIAPDKAAMEQCDR